MKIKDIVQNTLRKFGFEIRRTNASIEVFSLQKLLIKKENPIIFDIGACHGSVAMTYNELFKNPSIYCFEPFSESYYILQKNVSNFSNIKCLNCAISDKKGKANLNVNKNSATNSLLQSDDRGEEFWGKKLYDTETVVNVDTITIDEFIRDISVPHIDILKIDVQGGEYEVFCGAKESLSNQNISLIYSEMIMCPTYRGQHKISEYFTMLDSFGYQFLDFFNPVRRHNQLIQADVIFLNKSIMENIINY
ncbi:MAG: FkbM family methyltransferase [Bacteroidetes bacterium]|nr:MAG: FkbM family methyltransferase [Bacteroidota bacterium]